MRAALVCALAALMLAGQARAWSSDPTYRELASHSAGWPVGVRCVDEREAWRKNIWGAGMVDAPGLSGFMWLQDWVCEGIDLLYARQWHRELESVYADTLMIVVHEAMHLRGYRNEGRAQALALRRFRKDALWMGAPYATASRMLALAIAFHMSLPRDYRARGCRAPWVNEDGHLRGCDA